MCQVCGASPPQQFRLTGGTDGTISSCTNCADPPVCDVYNAIRTDDVDPMQHWVTAHGIDKPCDSGPPQFDHLSNMTISNVSHQNYSIDFGGTVGSKNVKLVGLSMTAINEQGSLDMLIGQETMPPKPSEKPYQTLIPVSKNNPNNDKYYKVEAAPRSFYHVLLVK